MVQTSYSSHQHHTPRFKHQTPRFYIIYHAPSTQHPSSSLQRHLPHNYPHIERAPCGHDLHERDGGAAWPRRDFPPKRRRKKKRHWYAGFPALFSLLLPPELGFPPNSPVHGMGEGRSEPGVKGEKRWGPLFGGMISLAPCQNCLPHPPNGAGWRESEMARPLRAGSGWSS